MNRIFLLRLGLDFVAAGLLLVALAYFWLGNTAHELIGTGMFVLIIVHNTFNRRWYGKVSKGRRDAGELFKIAITLFLLVTMVVLLTTSLMISRAVFSFLSLEGGFTARQMHTLAAYWALIIVSIHLGLSWSKIMSAVRGVFGIAASSGVRTLLLRATTFAIAIQGVRSSFEAGIGSKLSLEITMDWLDGGGSTLRFFLHFISIVGLYASLGHYTMKWLLSRKRNATAPRLADGRSGPARENGGAEFNG